MVSTVSLYVPVSKQCFHILEHLKNFGIYVQFDIVTPATEPLPYGRIGG